MTEKKTHRDFNNRSDALAFLKENARMSVGWPDGKDQMVTVYWSGKRHIMKAAEKKYWCKL